MWRILRAPAANPTATRVIMRCRDGEDAKLKLGNGSLFLMSPGAQDTHQHRIPKAGYACGPRVSLTFRGYVHG